MSKKSKPMTKDAARRIEKANADKNKGETPKDSFESRAKRAADNNQNRRK
jgi:hypothetical protein